MQDTINNFVKPKLSGTRVHSSAGSFQEKERTWRHLFEYLRNKLQFSHFASSESTSVIVPAFFK